jgi:hypothetical protein
MNGLKFPAFLLNVNTLFFFTIYSAIATAVSFSGSLEIFPEVFIKTTDPIIIIAARIIRGVNNSFANRVPNKIATRGFT